MIDSVRLGMDEILDRRLPLTGCCCKEHTHDWYRRSDDEQSWIECVHCADAYPL